MYILGINCYHADSSACLVKDGQLLVAVEEERFRRIKHWAGFPSKSISHCLEKAGIKLSEVDFISINKDPSANLLKKLIFLLKKRPNINLVFDRIKNSKKHLSIKNEIKKEFPNDLFTGKIINVEHHLAHLSSAFHVSPFEQSCILSVDGFGDFSSTLTGFGAGTKIEVNKKVYFPHSLGIFYQAMTQYLGFMNYGDEYKIMGLAPYGKPTHVDTLSKIINLKSDGTFELNLDYFIFHKTNFKYEWNNGAVKVDNLFSDKLIELLDKQRDKSEPIGQYHKNIAHSTQIVYEKALFHILNKLHNKYKNDNICIAGGCGMNSVANGKITENTPFKNVYIQPAAGDAGGALGSAYITWFEKSKLPRSFIMDHAYWGPNFTNDQIKKTLEEYDDLIKKENIEYKIFENEDELAQKTALEVSNGKVIGWFQGRLEWGPRALGNRSIIGDPRRSDMKDILNIKIKRRESFRPFAPSILREHVSSWFEKDDDVPFMMKVFQVKKDKKMKIPAVTHVDGSGRLQTVNKKTNNRYHKLISEFYKITEVPILLNTSFNENEPIVCTPEEALNCFLRTKMDVLVLENYLIKRI